MKVSNCFSAAVFCLLAITSFVVAELKEEIISHVIDVGGDEEDSGTLVVGGKEAPVGKYKFTSGMRQTATGQSFCGGTLVAPRYIITAAHCARQIRWVAIGTHYNRGSSGEKIQVSRVIVHPNYNARAHTNDIAIVVLSKSSRMPTVDLAAKSVTGSGFAGQTATLIGWGKTSHPGNPSPVLKELNVRIMTNQQCGTHLNRYARINTSMICAGGIHNQAACHGDSGGPLVIQRQNRKPLLVGAVSWGIPCGRGKPDAYARISSLRSFIDTHVRGHRWLRE